MSQLSHVFSYTTAFVGIGDMEPWVYEFPHYEPAMGGGILSMMAF